MRNYCIPQHLLVRYSFRRDDLLLQDLSKNLIIKRKCPTTTVPPYLVALFQAVFRLHRIVYQKENQTTTHTQLSKPFLDVVVFRSGRNCFSICLHSSAVRFERWVWVGGIFPNNLNRSLMDDLMKICARFSNDNLSVVADLDGMAQTLPFGVCVCRLI